MPLNLILDPQWPWETRHSFSWSFCHVAQDPTPLLVVASNGNPLPTPQLVVELKRGGGSPRLWVSNPRDPRDPLACDGVCCQLLRRCLAPLLVRLARLAFARGEGGDLPEQSTIGWLKIEVRNGTLVIPGEVAVLSRFLVVSIGE